MHILRPFLGLRKGPSASPWPIRPCIQKVFLANNSSNVPENGFRWLHPAGTTTEKLVVAAKFAQFPLLSHLTINTATPLSEGHFKEALTHLCRKTPIYRTCLPRRDGELWVCEYQEPKLDFKMITNGDLTTEINKLLLKPFEDSSEGPLWCTHVIPAHPDAQCPLPKLKEKFPHQYDLLFLVHHAISDGISIIVSFIHLMKLLEDVVSGTTVSSEPYGRVVSEQQSMALEEEMLKKLESNPKEFQHMVDDAAKVKFTPLLQEAFETPPKPDFPMDFVSTTFDPLILQSLHDRCRSIGITLNSAITSAINTALVELVAENGLERDTYSITSRHAVDLRRYWKGNPMTDFGNHLGAMCHTIDTPRYNRDNFWEYAKQFDDGFRKKLKERYLFQEKIIRSKLLPKDFDLESYYRSTPPALYEYYFSNILIPSVSNFGVGDTVQLTAMRTLANFSNCEFSNMHTLIWFRDTVTYNILFASGRISREVAAAFLDKIVSVTSSLAA